MQVDHNFQPCVPRPLDGSVQYRKLSLNIRITRERVDGPVSDRDPNMVQASSRNLLEIVLSDPSVPVTAETRRSFVLAKGLGVRVLVHDSPTRRPFLKERWSDPWLEHKPPTEVDTADFIVVVIERELTATQLTGVGAVSSGPHIHIQCRYSQSRGSFRPYGQ